MTSPRDHGSLTSERGFDEMNRREFLTGAAAPGLAAAFSPAQAVRGASFQAGYAEADITPEVGMEQPGGYGKAKLRKFHDACKARAAVFDDGRKRVALVGLDALGVPRHLVLEARRGVQEQCGIPAEAILVGASHSHSSGPLVGVLPGQYDHASALVRHLAYDMSTCADPRYMEQVRRQIIAAVVKADAARVPARSAVASGVEETVAFNRRFRMKNGLTYTHPGQGNPDVLGYAGPTDPEVGVLASWNEAGKLLGCVVNFACHATTSPDGISANWIYYMERTIRGIMGPDVKVVFLQGACGDVTQVDNLSPYRRPGGEQWAQLVGGRVGAETAKVLLGMYPGSLAPLDAASKVLRIARRTPDEEKVRTCLELVQKDPNEIGATRWTFAKETVMLHALLEKEPAAEVEVQAVQIGPALYVSNPAELFCEFGLELKAKSAFPHTYPVELANGCVGYVPTEEALGPHGGGYETRLTSYSNLEPAAGRRMVEAGLELAAGMRPGIAPEPPRADAFHPDDAGIGSHPWSYGDVPPELT